MADPDLQMGGWGHPDPEIRGGAGLKKFFSGLRASVWSKNEGGGAVPLAPLLDPPLLTVVKSFYKLVFFSRPFNFLRGFTNRFTIAATFGATASTCLELFTRGQTLFHILGDTPWLRGMAGKYFFLDQ